MGFRALRSHSEPTINPRYRFAALAVHIAAGSAIVMAGMHTLNYGSMRLMLGQVHKLLNRLRACRRLLLRRIV